MTEQVIMPRLGLNMEMGTVARWNVNEGSVFHAGDVLCEVESEKSTAPVEADFGGRVLKLLASVGEEVAVLEPIMLAERM